MAAREAKLGRHAAEVFGKEYEHVKFQGPLSFEIDMENRLREMPAGARKAAAATMLAYGGELEARGVLPKNAVKKMLGLLEQQFPSLASYLREFGAHLDQQASTSFKLAGASRAVKATLHEIQDYFGFWHGETTHDVKETMGDLEQIIAQRRGPVQKLAIELVEKTQAGMAAKEKLLRQQWGETWRWVSEHPTSGDIAAFTKRTQELMDSGAITVQEGSEAINRALEKELSTVGLSAKIHTVKGELSIKGAGAKEIFGAVGKAQGGLLQFGAPGEAGRDSIPLNVGGLPIMVAPGEQVAVFNRHQAPIVNEALAAVGYGGLSGLFKAVSTPNYMATGGIVAPTVGGYGAMKSIAQGALNEVAKAANRAGNAKASSAGGAGGISSAGLSGSLLSIVHQIAARMGWSGQVQDWLNVIMRESGGSMTAKNPTSGAYGIAQFIEGPAGYAKYGGNVGTLAGQLVAMANYIKGRYGSPAAAWAHELADKWYGLGGLLRFASGGFVSNGTSSKPRAGMPKKAKKAPAGAKKKTFAQLVQMPEFPATRSFGMLNAILNQDVPALQELYSVHSEQDQFTLEGMEHKGEFIFTPEGGTPQVDAANVGMRLGQLHELFGYQLEVKQDLEHALGLTGPLHKNLDAVAEQRKQEVEKLQAHVKKIQETIKRKLAEIKKLEKERDTVRKSTPKTKGAKEAKSKKLASIERKISTLKQQVRALGGEETSVGTGGEIGVLNTDIEKLTKQRETAESRAAEVDTDQQGIIGYAGVAGIMGVGGSLGETQRTLEKLARETGELEPSGVSKMLAEALKAAGGGPESGEELANRENEQLKEKLKFAEEEARTNAEALKVFGGAGDIGEGGLATVLQAAARNGSSDTLANLPFGGSFLHGGVVPGPVGAPILVEAHGGEEYLGVGNHRPAPVVEHHQHFEVNTVHPGDPKTLAAIGNAATRGQRMQGARQSKVYKPGL